MAGTDGVVSVTFSAGAPLDPDDLNLLQSNIQLINTTASVYNKTIDGIKTIPSIQSGSITVTNLKKGSPRSANLPVLQNDPQVSILIHQHSAMDKDGMIMATLNKTTTPWTVNFRTNNSKEFETLKADWIAVAMVPVG